VQAWLATRTAAEILPLRNAEAAQRATSPGYFRIPWKRRAGAGRPPRAETAAGIGGLLLRRRFHWRPSLGSQLGV